jgi:malonyl-CoA decarboxylase
MLIAQSRLANMPSRVAPHTERSSDLVPRPRVTLFGNRFNPAAEPLATLIDRRRTLLEGLDQHPEWAAMEAALSDLLKSRLNSDGLQLVRLNQHTPTHVLDQIVKYEAVHRVQDSRDLERRLAEDRRCYAFFHPELPDEPLIFTEVALTHGMSSNVEPLIAPEAPIVESSTAAARSFIRSTAVTRGSEACRLATR